jgi:hypothetical protein
VTAVGPEHEAPQARGESASDAFTVAFGDPAQRVYGLARLGVVPGDPPTRSGMGLLFDGTDPVAVQAEGAVSDDTPADVAMETVEPLRSWRVSFGAAFALEVTALAAPAVLDPDHPVARAGGMAGYEQLVRVRGTAAGRKIDCLGQRGHSWGAPDWSKIALTRTVSAWMDTETAVSLSAVRPAGAKHHADEAVAATLVSAGEPHTVAEPLLSTTFDGDGRQRHAGLELWLSEEGGFPYRAAGEVLCGTTLDLGRLRLDASFFAWRGEGRTGVGRYDVLRRADGA